MTVTYPRKLYGNISAQQMLDIVIKDREIHLITLNRYRYSEQRSCKDLTEVIERLDGQPRELIKDLSNHIREESQHAFWLTELILELGGDLGTPPGPSYIDEYEKYVGSGSIDVIETLAAINVTEKRGCNFFSAHIKALKNAEQTEDNIKIRECIERIFPEEANHVRWGNRWLATLAKESPENARKVEEAKRKYDAIENAAFEAGMDITVGAELRRFNRVIEISETLPIWERPQYLAEQLPRLIPDVNKARFGTARMVFQRNPADFIQRFIPMVMGLNKQQPKKVEIKEPVTV
jgi:rubrerythrin